MEVLDYITNKINYEKLKIKRLKSSKEYKFNDSTIIKEIEHHQNRLAAFKEIKQYIEHD